MKLQSLSLILDLTWTAMDTIFRCERPHQNVIPSSVVRIRFKLLPRIEKLQKGDPNLNSEILEKFVELMLLIEGLSLAYGHFYFMEDLYDMVLFLSNHQEFVTEPIRLSPFSS